jgi:hypothetical protein
MSTPTWRLFLVRVGGVLLFFAVAILIAREYFPGYEAMAVAIVATLVVGSQVLRQLVRRRGHAK